MKKLIATLLLLVMVVSLFSGCGKTEENKDDGKDKPKALSLSVCLASEPDTIDPALNSAVDGATMIIHAFSGLVGFKKADNGSLELYPECATELAEGTVDPDTGKVTYEFTLRDGLKWSDGSDLTAEDFVYSWNRAVSPDTGADYGYMFDIIDGYAEAAEGKGKLNVKASEDGKKLTIVINNECPYFYELLAFPTYMPVKKSTIDENGESWATEPATYISNGPYIMKEWVHDSKIVYTKNEKYYNADKITVDEITFYLSDDQNTMLANYKTGTWDFIDDVPTAEIAALKEQYKDEFNVSGQLGTYYTIFNVNKSLLPSTNTLTGDEKRAAEAEIRKALGLLLDRNYICEGITQAGQVPASTFVGMGLTDADGKTEFYQNAADAKKNGYLGYYNTAKEAHESNVASALETLKKYYTWDDSKKQFTDFPSIEYIYNTSDAHKAIAEYIQSAYGTYGITVNITNQEWNTFLNTRKDGNYTLARNGWLSDYNDPMSFLDMWTTDSGNNDAQFGKDDDASAKTYSIDLSSAGVDYKVENGTWAETYDYVIKLVKSTTDKEKRYALMHVAEDLLMSTGAICPLYYYVDIYMSSPDFDGIYASPLGYKYFMYATEK